MGSAAQLAAALQGVVLLLGATTASLAQPRSMERGEAHAKLDVFLGTWVAEGVVHTPEGDVASSGTSVYTWTLGDVWLREELVGQVPTLGTIHGATLMAFDEANGDYCGAWLDNLTPRTYPFRARWTSENELVFVSDFDQPFRMEIHYTFKDQNTIDVVQFRQVGDASRQQASRLTMRRDTDRGSLTGRPLAVTSEKTDSASIERSEHPLRVFDFYVGRLVSAEPTTAVP